MASSRGKHPAFWGGIVATLHPRIAGADARLDPARKKALGGICRHHPRPRAGPGGYGSEGEDQIHRAVTVPAALIEVAFQQV